MMMGTAGELPKPPPKPVQFLEDMTEAEVMEALDIPPGLENLGNTCYMVRRRKKKIGVAKYSSLRNSL